MDKLGYTFYPKDFISDPDVMMMTPAQRGIFRDLIDLAYLSDNNIKYSLVQLSKYCNAEVEDIEEILNLKGLKIGEFWTIPSCNKRILKARSSKENGSKGGRPSKPKQNPTNNPVNNPTKTQVERQREREKEKEIESKKEVKKEEPIEKHSLIVWIEKNTPRVQTMKEPISNQQAEKIVEDYKLKPEAVKETLLAMNNSNKLKNYISANSTLRNWIRLDEKRKESQSNLFNPPKITKIEWGNKR
jgi:hypothetical protein